MTSQLSKLIGHLSRDVRKTAPRSGEAALTRPEQAEVELLLIEWANLPTVTTAALDLAVVESFLHLDKFQSTPLGKFIRRYPEVFARGDADNIALALWPQQLLRKAWDAASARDYRASDWFTYRARDFYDLVARAMNEESERAVISGQTGPPPLTQFERAMYHFHSIARRARRCANAQCTAPYFFSAAKAEAYCSRKCSATSMQEVKQQWWNENRDRINADRRRQYKKSHRRVRKEKNGARKRRPI